jgi:hypothetical protein
MVQQAPQVRQGCMEGRALRGNFSEMGGDFFLCVGVAQVLAQGRRVLRR